MTVGVLITNIANKIRNILGIEETMTLNKMSSKLQEVEDELDIQSDLIQQIYSAIQKKQNNESE